MNPNCVDLSPTRNRPLNVFLGLLLLVASLLVLLALITYRSSDPSLNTATSEAGVHNWMGLFGASLSDLLLQTLGLAAFLPPLWLGGTGWRWLRSRPGGSAWLRGMGMMLALVFVPAIFGLLPWHWLWLHVIPVGGQVGIVAASLLVRYLNTQGAWLVATPLAVAGTYFALAASSRTFAETLQLRRLQIAALCDRWRERRAERRETRAAEREAKEAALQGPDSDLDSDSGQMRPSFFGALFRRRKRAAEVNPVDEIPAYQRTPLASAEPVEIAAQTDEQVPIAIPAHRSSIWERDAADSKPASVPALAPVPNPVPSNVLPIRPQPTPPQPVESRADEDFYSEPVPVPAPVSALAEVPIPVPPATESVAIHDVTEAELHAETELPATAVAPSPVLSPVPSQEPKSAVGFKLPPNTLLAPSSAPQAIREDELRQEAKVLVEKCGEFDVRGQVVQINPGPMVTTYEFKPEAGVKYSRVTGLADDLCLAMRAESILIERMAGKSTVGIQVPNRERETIHLRDVIESETFHKAKSPLTLAMGKDINGRIVTADLASMPHVLIAGSTGSGKSVAINAMIMSLLYRTTPAQVRLILVDPKRVELGMYAGIPHLFTPIITEAKLAANALRNAVREMERRLKLLASRSVRNIDQYNKLFDSANPSLFDRAVDEQPLPYIVIIIDELADLMLLDRANVEESITRLAQMARAVGIHLILATQRPSVDVITGLIKANIPTRISFRLATKVDSRTILDANGAAALLGRGDMLFLPPGTSRLMRLHAPYVSEKETAAVVDFWKAQGQAEYVEGFLESPKDEHVGVEGSNSDPDENDPLFNDAVQLVFEFGKASTSLLQRRLRIGYGRAAHLVDLMENDGLIGPADGSRPRELLKAPDWLHEISSTANE